MSVRGTESKKAWILIPSLLMLKWSIYMALLGNDERLFMSPCQGVPSRVIGSSKLQLCQGSCKCSDISSGHKEPCEKHQGNSYSAHSAAAFPELSLWDADLGRKRGRKERWIKGRREEERERRKENQGQVASNSISRLDWTLFFAALWEGEVSYFQDDGRWWGSGEWVGGA